MSNLTHKWFESCDLHLFKSRSAKYRREKASREKWIASHPKAASAGKSILRQLEKGGNIAIGLGENHAVGKWMKRKELVTVKITGKKGKRTTNPEKAKKVPAPQKKAKVLLLSHTKAEAKANPSLFVVILRYLVPLEQIDAIMKQHAAYLQKHYDKGEFLVSGRQVPRTGGIILARAKNRNAIEKAVKQDPFIKRKMASADIIEFTASRSGKGMEGWLKASLSTAIK